MHELLHLDDEEVVEQIYAEVKQLPNVLPDFWINQGEEVLECELDSAWAERFYDDALALVGKSWVAETRAEVLANVVISLSGVDGDASNLHRIYRNRIDQDVPKSGAKEFLDGLIAMVEERNLDKAELLFERARNKARKAGEIGLIDKIDTAEDSLSPRPSLLLDLLDRFME